MDILFSGKKLSKQFNEAKTMQKAFGAERSKRIRVVMMVLRAAPSLVYWPHPIALHTAAMN